MKLLSILTALSLLSLPSTLATTNATQTNTTLTLHNSRLFVALTTKTGYVTNLTLDGVNMLGTPISSSSAIGPYMDTTQNFTIVAGSVPKLTNYAPGATATYKIYQGVDKENVGYAGMSLSQIVPNTGGQLLEQYWFLRDGETGLHMFTRVAYPAASPPYNNGLAELRTLFRPQGTFWTHLSIPGFSAPQPVPNPAATGLGIATVVQDATWDLSNRTGDPWVDEVSPYYTKYSLSDTFRKLDAHGLFADGSNTPGNLTYGVWTVMNTRETYYGGPTHSDLLIDGILYNYIVSNHHGDQTPNITNGYDRTFGPSLFYLNKGAKGGSLDDLRNDAAQYADPSYASSFYDSIAQHVPGYVTTSSRGSFKSNVNLPKGATNAIAILASNRVDYQDNVVDNNYQYWEEVHGPIKIDRVKAGTYRLTIYADGIFGQYTQDDIVIKAGEENHDTQLIKWEPEWAGTELWRIGTPDKSSGEYRHGDHPDPTHPLHAPEFRIYWGAYDFINDFPQGVNYYVGKDDPSTALNYIHWSTFGGYANAKRPVEVLGNGNINNWTVMFDVKAAEVAKKTQATFTVQLAGAKGATGNTDSYNATQLYNDIPYVVAVNGKQLPTWIIPYTQSSSCGVRSAIICYQVAHKFNFPTSYLLTNQTNKIVLSLPFNATDYESALLPRSIYVQYDAMRLEVQ